MKNPPQVVTSIRRVVKYFRVKPNDALTDAASKTKKGRRGWLVGEERRRRRRRRRRRKNISATLTATGKQSRQFRSLCNCSCSVYFLLRAPPKKTLYPPLEGNCYLRDGEPCRNYSPFNLASLFPSPLIPLALLSCHCVHLLIETLRIVPPSPFLFPFFFRVYIWYMRDTAQHAVCTVLINFRVFARDSTENVDPMVDFYLFRAVFSIHISDREATSSDFSYFFFSFFPFLFQIAVSIVSNSTRCSNVTIRFVFYEFVLWILIPASLIFNDALWNTSGFYSICS